MYRLFRRKTSLVASNRLLRSLFKKVASFKIYAQSHAHFDSIDGTPPNKGSLYTAFVRVYPSPPSRRVHKDEKRMRQERLADDDVLNPKIA